jgi:hypothetical protein
MSEQALMNAIAEAIGGHGSRVLVTRVNAGGRPGATRGSWVKGAPAGTADLICCVGGRYLELEVKTPDGKQNKGQRQREANVKERGGAYRVVRSVDEARAVVAELLGEVPQVQLSLIPDVVPPGPVSRRAEAST